MKLGKLLITFLMLWACGDSKKGGSEASQTLIDQVNQRTEQIRTWTNSYNHNGVAGIEENDGDAAVFNGILWFSGEDNLIPLSSYLEVDGRPRRNPLRVATTPEENSFSRDQTLGLLAYLAKTKDIEMGNRLTQYINSISNHVVKSCPEDICNFSLPLFYTYNMVATEVGFEKLPLWLSLDEDNSTLIEENKDNLTTEEKDEIVASTFSDSVLYIATKLASPGYPLHLAAVQLMLKKNYSWSKMNQRTANLLQAREKWNPFYVWLAQGVSEEALQRWLDLAPQNPPTCSRVDWILQRSEEQMRQNCSYGWDFIFVSNLFKKE